MPTPRLSLSTAQLQRLVILTGTAVFTSLVIFGAFYYWDRYVHLGDQSPLERGAVQLEQAIRENPQDPDRRVALAEYYLNQGAPDQALEQARQVLSAYPDNAGALLVGGIAHVRLEQPAEAVELLEQFVALRKDMPMARTDTALETAYYFLGECYLKLERPGDAARVLEAALEITPTDADALYQAGRAYSAQGRHATAIEHYAKAVRFVLDFTDAYSGMIESYTALNLPEFVAYARGMQAYSLQDYSTAQTHLEYATDTLTKFSPAFLGLGLTYEKQGHYDLALTAVQRALELSPADFAAQQALGRLQAVQK